MNGGGDFYAILKVQNGRIRKAMEVAGIPNAARLAERAGQSPSAVGELLNFRTSPRRQDGSWRNVTNAVCGALSVEPDDLFPDHLCETMESNQLAGYVERGQIPHAEARRIPGPVEAAINEELKEKFRRLLQTLSSREAEVLRRRWGLDGGREYTLKECATILGVSRSRIMHIEAKAIRKLQHPVRAEHLEGFVEPTL